MATTSASYSNNWTIVFTMNETGHDDTYYHYDYSLVLQNGGYMWIGRNRAWVNWSIDNGITSGSRDSINRNTSYTLASGSTSFARNDYGSGTRNITVTASVWITGILASTYTRTISCSLSFSLEQKAPTVTTPQAVTITSFGLSSTDPTKVSVHWTNNSSGTGTYTGIKVEYRVDNGDWTTASSNAGASATYYYPTTVADDTKYDVKITPYNGAGNGSAQTSTFYSTPPDPTLSTISSLVKYEGNYYGIINGTDTAKYPNGEYSFYLNSGDSQYLIGTSQTPSITIDTSTTDIDSNIQPTILSNSASTGSNDRLRQESTSLNVTLTAGRNATTVSNGVTSTTSVTKQTNKTFSVPIFELASVYVNIPDEKTYSGLYINDPNSTNAGVSVHLGFSGSSSSSSSSIGSVDIYQQLDTTTYSDTLAVRNAILAGGNFRKITNVAFNGQGQATSSTQYPFKTNKDVYALYVPASDSSSVTYTNSATGCSKLTLSGSNYSGQVTIPA